MLEDSTGAVVRYRVNRSNGAVQAETRGGVRPSFWRRVSPQTAERVRVSLANAREAARREQLPRL
jgi:hypothetical protein